MRRPDGRGTDVHDRPSFIVLFTAMQTLVEQWYPDKIQPSPEGRNDADTGDVVAFVVDAASGEVATMAKTVARERPSTIETATATCSNLSDARTPPVSQPRGATAEGTTLGPRSRRMTFLTG